MTKQESDIKFSDFTLGLEKEDQDMLRPFFEKIQSKVENSNINEHGKYCFYPILRTIFLSLKVGYFGNKKDGIFWLEKHPEARLIVCEKIDVNHLFERYEEFYKNIIPVVEPYFKNLDAHAEINLMFCKDYVFYLVSEYKKEMENQKNKNG